ncbi:MAG: amidophosphoribosyltransferase [Clostridiales bacterium]|nr:amidophosphoribosyltransferase [Clostridiales bacterium]
MAGCEVFSKLHEECGVFGIFRHNGDSVVPETYRALYALQHRGQESCGIAVNRDGVITCHKDLGLVNDVFTRDTLEKMPEGSIAVGHCRYATSGGHNRGNAQPLLINHLKGQMALCHNGNLTNAFPLREEFELGGAIFHTTTDSEVIAYLITRERLRAPSIEAAVLAAMERMEGAYSLVLTSPTKLIAARDPRGFRPLCMGELDGDVVFASETCALDAIGATFVRDIEPGEVVRVSKEGVQSYRLDKQYPSSLCVFEFIYFARPDSVIEGASVHEARLRAGAYLALDHPVDADIVVGVPDSGIDAALGYARQSGIPYGVGFIKNRYIGRTFIQPTQKQRADQVRLKLNVLANTVRGKRVVLVDDSIVRGTTAARIVRLLREAGATEVHMRLSAPPFISPCYFGTDIDSVEGLIAYHHTVEEIRQIIGVDTLGYLSLAACDKLAAGAKCGFCKGCFTGEYPAPIPKEEPGSAKFERYLSRKTDIEESA